MHYDLTITAVANRDESCNLFSLTEVHRFSIAAPPTSAKIKALLEEHKVKYLAAWPHRRTAAPTLVALDATINLTD